VISKHKHTILPTVVIAGALALAGCGGDEGNGVDRAFVADMVPHHRSAVAMAEIATERGESPFVRALADDIVSSQRKEIATMRREDAGLAGAGVKPTSLGVPTHMLGMDDAPATLRSAEPFDRKFIEMMLPHHEGAVTMAKVELAKGDDPELKQLGADIIAAQKREIVAMRGELETLGG